ncbi:hypothetical protein Tco_1289775, partial [Tanacetum coccineum]
MVCVIKHIPTYLGFATGATPLKKVRKFKKPASPQLSIVPVSPEEPMGKSKRINRPAKKSTKAPARGVVIRETLKMPLSKKKENITVEKDKGIDLLFEVALTEDAQFEEVRKKSLREFHKTHPSGFGPTKTAPSAKIKPSVTNDGIGGNDEDDNNDDHDSSGEDSDQENDSDDDKTQSDNENESDSEHETDENESGSESNQEEKDEDIGDGEEEVKDEFVKTPSNDSDDEDETKITDKAEGDKVEEMDYTTSQLYDNVDIRLNKPVQADDETAQKEGTNAELTNVQQGNENTEISQVIEDAHVTLSTVTQKTEVPVTSSFHSSNLAAKFLNFADIPTTEAEIYVFRLSLNLRRYTPQSLPSFTPPPQLSTPIPPPTTEATNPQSALLDFASVFQFNNRVTTLEKDVSELKKDDPLKTQVTALVDEYLDARLGATRDEFMNYLLMYKGLKTEQKQ